MAAGTAYARRYAGGFVDKPTLTTPIDQAFLNAVEAALLQLIGSAPTADGQVAQWDNANTRFGPALLLNKNIDPAAAIASSKIDFSGGNALTNAAIAGAAAISRSKLDFGSGLVNADIATAAALAVSKLAAGSNGQVLGTVGGVPAWTTGVLTYRKATTKAVNTTVAATDLLNAEITIAAGALGATGILRLTAWGDWIQNIGTNQVPPRFQVVLGGTTMIDTNTQGGGVASSATRNAWAIDVLIANLTTTSQSVKLIGTLNSPALTAGAAAFTLGEGIYVNDDGPSFKMVGVHSGLAVDTTLARTLVLNVINGNAGAAYETKLLGALVEVI